MLRSIQSGGPAVIRSTFFLFRILVAWGVLFFVAILIWSELPLIGNFDEPLVLAITVTAAFVVTGVASHLNRVRLLAGRIDSETVRARQRRQRVRRLGGGSGHRRGRARCHRLVSGRAALAGWPRNRDDRACTRRAGVATAGRMTMKGLL